MRNRVRQTGGEGDELHRSEDEAWLPLLGERAGVRGNVSDARNEPQICRLTVIEMETTPRCSLAELNFVSRDEFVHFVGSVFEGSPWIAEDTWTNRPFTNLNQL